MQTFLVCSSFSDSAKCLDFRRLGKQRLESYQLLKILQKGPFVCKKCKQAPIIKEMDYCPYCKLYNILIKTPYYNHPATQMWKGYELSLFDYLISICEEWQNRGYKDTIEQKAKKELLGWCATNCKDERPKWINEEKLYSSHRAALLYKNYVFYKTFNWTETPKIDYYWPSKNSY